MNTKKAEVIEKKANEARQKLKRPDKCDIDMEELMQVHNIHYISKRLPDNISGASMTTENGTRIIVVSEKQPPTRKKFTIAHELGHLLLKHDTALNTQDKGMMNTQQEQHNTPSQILFRDDKTSEGSDWREVEANHFAASLLMSKEILNREIHKLIQKKSKPYLSESDVCELASIFEVSPISMSIRLSRLGFM